MPKYDQLFDQARTLQDSPQRTAMYRKMNELIDAYALWVVHSSAGSDVAATWVHNYRRHPVENTAWGYLNIDSAQRDAGH